MKHTAIMLLQHGQLTLADFTEITGWSYKKSARVLHDLWVDKVVCKPRRGVYALAGVAHE